MLEGKPFILTNALQLASPIVYSARHSHIVLCFCNRAQDTVEAHRLPHPGKG